MTRIAFILVPTLVGSLLFAAPLPAQQLSIAARDAFNMGVRQFQAAQFRSAAESFGKAVERAPNLLNARVYLAASWVQAYVPDDASPENAEVAKSALAACLEVLKRDPSNVAATDSIATLHFQMRDFIRSREWNLKVIALDPNSKTSLYMLGAINWSDFASTLKEARTTLNMSSDDPGPLPDEELRTELRAQSLKSIEEGIEFERAALNLDVGYARAMLTIADLLRARADLGDEAAYKADIAEANDWVTRAAKAAGTAK